MKPATNTLEELFRTEVRYMVPLYQRPYVWKKDTHWAPLWQDVVDVVERQADPALGDASHFLGAVVLDHQRTNPGEVAQRLVIDGQQRLTTLQLLIAAVASEAAAAGADVQARVLRKLTLNDEDLAPGDARFKVWPTNANRAAFRAVLAPDSGAGAGETGSPANTIQEAFEFFSTSARVWARREGPDHHVVVGRFDELRIALTSLLNLVSINLEPGDNAQVIFETLNARGTPLLALDLVKNALFYRAADAGEDTDLLHDDFWLPQLGDDYWRVERRQGRLKRPRAELFLMHWLSMKLGRIVPATELFSEFRAQILDRTEPGEIGALVRELCADAAVMRSFDDQPSGSPEARFFETLDALDTSTVIPVALALFKNADITIEQRRRALGAIESWLVRRMLAGLTSKNYNKTSADLLQAIGRRPDLADQQIIEELAASSSAISVWPDDKTIAGVVVTRAMYGAVAQPRLVMVLSAVELARRQANNKTESVTLPPKLTLEHLMPQKWRDAWGDPELDDDEARDVGLVRDAVVHRLGNLTLTSGPLNSSLSNNAWAVKAPALREHSLLALNSEVSALPAWDVDDIHRRGHALAGEISAIWPSPADFGVGEPEELPSLEQLLADVAVIAAAASGPTSGVQLATLLVAGFLEDGETLIAARAGVAATATVTGEGKLACAGEIFDTPSAAAVHAAATTAENGWTFWLAERDDELVTLKDIRTQFAGASGRDSDRHRMRRRYWASLLPVAAEITPLHARVSPGPDTWISAGAGWSGVHYIYEAQRHSGAVRLYLEHRQGERNHAILSVLSEHAEEIHERFGGPLVWVAKADVKRCSIGIQTPVGYADPESSWPAAHREMAQTMVRLVHALEPYLAAAVASAPDGPWR